MVCSETVGLRTRPVSDQKIDLGLGLGLFARCGFGLGGLVLFRKTRSCYARHRKDHEVHSN